MASKTVRISLDLFEQIEKLSKLIKRVFGHETTPSSIINGMIAKGASYYLTPIGLVINNSFEDDGVTKVNFSESVVKDYEELVYFFNHYMDSDNE